MSRSCPTVNACGTAGIVNRMKNNTIIGTVFLNVIKTSFVTHTNLQQFWFSSRSVNLAMKNVYNKSSGEDMMPDRKKIRKDFPITKKNVYFQSAAMSPIPKLVFTAIVENYRKIYRHE
jgi:hypothetical protein